MKRIAIIAALAALLGGAALADGFDFRTTGTQTTTILQMRGSGTTPPLSPLGGGKLWVDAACGCFKISENGGPWTQLSTFVGSGAVSSVFGRVGAIAAQQADYDSFFLTPAEGDALFLTPAEGNAAYAETATGNTFTGNQVVNAGTITSGTYAIGVTGTLQNVAADQYGNYFQMTGAGNSAGSQYAARFELLSGYTGTLASYGLRSVNNSDAPGTSFTNGNYGVDGVSHGSGISSTALYNIGVHGQARWAPTSVGVMGLGTYTNGVSSRLGQNSVGVYGKAIADATGKTIGGIFTVGATDASVGTSAVLIADNVGEAVPIFLARDNGSAVVTVADGGNTSLTGTLSVGGANQNYRLDVKTTSSGDATFDTIANFYKASTNETNLIVRSKNSLIDLAASYIVGGGGPQAALSLSTTPSGGSPTERVRINTSGEVGIAKTPTAGVELDVNGDVAASGTVTIGGGTAIAKHISATASLDFPDTATASKSDLTITVTGAADGDTVALGVPYGSTTGVTCVFDAFVSAADTVTVRFINANDGINRNPAVGTFRVDVWKH